MACKNIVSIINNRVRHSMKFEHMFGEQLGYGSGSVEWMMGMKCPCFVSLSIITHRLLNPCEGGRPSIKSIEIWVQGWEGIMSGCSKPLGCV